MSNTNNKTNQPGVAASASAVAAAAAAAPKKLMYEKGKGTFYSFSETSEEIDSSWELTWPIWHMLPRDERKAIAIKHGMKTIGEFEEFMSLHKAEEISNFAVQTSLPYSNELIYTDYNNVRSEEIVDEHRLSEAKDDDRLKGEEEDENEEESEEEEIEPKSHISGERLEEEEGAGEILTLIPEDLIHRILSFLDIQYYNFLSTLHPAWSNLTSSEHAYKLLCTRTYLIQSKKKTLLKSNFKNSYKYMFHHRPRVLTGCGLYILKYSEIRKIERNMCSDLPVGAILEMIYYRYLLFLEDGQVLYALTTAHPMEMIPRFRAVRSKHAEDKHIVRGRYELTKFCVRVYVQHPWTHVMLECRILPGLQFGMDHIPGLFTVLSLEKHLMSATGDDWNHGDDVISLPVPTGYFRFLGNWSL